MSHTGPQGNNIISKYIVSADPKDGYYTSVQAAMDAANATAPATPITVYLKAGTYIEDLTLYPNVYLVGDSRDAVILHGRHIPPFGGNISFEDIYLFSDTAIIFHLVGGSLTTVMNRCYFNSPSVFDQHSGFIFNYIYDCIDRGSSCLNDFPLPDTNFSVYNTVMGSGANTTYFAKNTIIENSTFNSPIEFAGYGPCTCNFVNFSSTVKQDGSTGTFNNCIFSGAITATVTINMFACTMADGNAFTGCTINAYQCYIGSSTYTTNGTATYKDCYFHGDITANAGTTVVLDACRIDAANTVSGAGTITYAGNYLGTQTILGDIATAPVASSTATSTLGAITLGTALQNTTGYDILVNYAISVTSSTTATIVLGVGSTSTPSTDTVVASFSTATPVIYTLTALVPNNYYVLIDTTGTIVVATTTTQVCPL